MQSLRHIQVFRHPASVMVMTAFATCENVCLLGNHHVWFEVTSSFSCGNTDLVECGIIVPCVWLRLKIESISPIFEGAAMEEHVGAEARPLHRRCALLCDFVDDLAMSGLGRGRLLSDLIRRNYAVSVWLFDLTIDLEVILFLRYLLFFLVYVKFIILCPIFALLLHLAEWHRLQFGGISTHLIPLNHCLCLVSGIISSLIVFLRRLRRLVKVWYRFTAMYSNFKFIKIGLIVVFEEHIALLYKLGSCFWLLILSDLSFLFGHLWDADAFFNALLFFLWQLEFLTLHSSLSYCLDVQVGSHLI